MGKSSNTFDQLLIYWKIYVSRNNLQVYKVRFLICLFKLIAIYHSVLSKNCNIIFPQVLVQYGDTPGVVLKEEQP